MPGPTCQCKHCAACLPIAELTTVIKDAVDLKNSGPVVHAKKEIKAEEAETETNAGLLRPSRPP